MIDHIGLNVSDFERSKSFYEQALTPLGITIQMQFGRGCGFGVEGVPSGENSSLGRRLHGQIV